MSQKSQKTHAMQEMMKQLTVLTKSVAIFHDLDRHRNPYGPNPYWNNNRGPERDPNRRRPEYPENPEKRNVNWCDENDEEPTNTSHLMTNQTTSIS